jgi:hypothetical protein
MFISIYLIVIKMQSRNWWDKHIKSTLEEIARRCVNPTLPLATIYTVIPSANTLLGDPGFTYGTFAGTAGVLLLGEKNDTKKGIRYAMMIPALAFIAAKFITGDYLEATKTGSGMLFGGMLGISEKKLEERL